MELLPRKGPPRWPSSLRVLERQRSAEHKSNAKAANRRAARAFRPLTPSARSGNRVAGDRTKNSLSAPEQELYQDQPSAATGKVLDRQSPYKPATAARQPVHQRPLHRHSGAHDVHDQHGQGAAWTTSLSSDGSAASNTKRSISRTYSRRWPRRRPAWAPGSTSTMMSVSTRASAIAPHFEFEQAPSVMWTI